MKSQRSGVGSIVIQNETEMRQTHFFTSRIVTTNIDDDAYIE